MISAEEAREITLYEKAWQKELKEYDIEVERRIRKSCSLSHNNVKFELPTNTYNEKIINHLRYVLSTNGYAVSVLLSQDVIELTISW